MLNAKKNQNNRYLRLISIYLLTAMTIFSTSIFAKPIERILILGNSITIHTPNTAIGWNGNWGMAATEQKYDFPHLLAVLLENSTSNIRPSLYPKNISDFESNNANYDFKKLDFIGNYNPDLVVVFLGDNVKSDKFDAIFFKIQYKNLLQVASKTVTHSIFCVGTWWGNRRVDAVISATCGEVGGTFVDIRHISSLPGMKAARSGLFSNKGVAAHPSDEGMKSIAEVLFNSILKAQK